MSQTHEHNTNIHMGANLTFVQYLQQFLEYIQWHFKPSIAYYWQSSIAVISAIKM